LAGDDGGVSVVVLVAVLAVLLLINLLNHRWRTHWYLRTCVVGAAIILAIGLASGLSWDELGLGRSSLLRGALWGAGTIALVFAIYLIGLSIPSTRRFFEDDRLSGRTGSVVAKHALVEVPLGTVLLEETAFRAVIYADVLLASGTVMAVAVSSLVFGVWHVLPAITWHESNVGIAESLGERHERARGIVVLVSVVGTTVAGVIFCMLRIWSDSLLAPMAFHWAINGLGLFFVWWLRRR